MIAAIEFRSDDDPDIRPYVHDRCVDMRIVEPSPEITASRSSLLEALRAVIRRLIGIKVAGLSTYFTFACKWHLEASGSRAPIEYTDA